MVYYRINDNDWRRTVWLNNLDAADPYIRQAIMQVKTDADDTVSVHDSSRKSLYKFGETGIAGGGTQVFVGTLSTSQFLETFSTSNNITHVASSSTAVTGAAVVQGHTIDAEGRFTYVSQNVTLAGQAKTALATPLARASRMYNDGTVDWASNVYVAEDVAFTAGIPSTGVHLVGIAADNQSQHCGVTTANTEYLFITQVHAEISSKLSNAADVRLKIRRTGGVFRTVWRGTCDTDSNRTVSEAFSPYIIMPKNCDIIMTAESSAAANSVGVSANFNGVVAKVQ